MSRVACSISSSEYGISKPSAVGGEVAHPGLSAIWKSGCEALNGASEVPEHQDRPRQVSEAICLTQSKHCNHSCPRVPPSDPADVEWSLIEDRTTKEIGPRQPIATGKRDANVRVLEANPGQSYTVWLATKLFSSENM